MPDGALLLGFVAASVVVLLLPGPGVLYVVARSVAQGRRAGLVSALGLSAGAFVHAVAAMAGLSALLLTSATAFTVVKLLGAGYLIYLGVQALRSARAPVAAANVDAASWHRLIADGVIISVFNPKIALFFIAFLPQFVDPARGPVATQMLLLGGLYCTLALLTDGSYALLAGSARRWLGGRLLRGPLPRCLSGGLYIGLGVYAAFGERRV